MFIITINAFCKFRPEFVGTIASISTGSNFMVQMGLDKEAQELWDSGVVVVVASGDEAIDGCESTFCRGKRVICVAPHEYDESTCVKKMYTKSDYGPCVDIMAPGQDILTASGYNNIGEFILLHISTLTLY